MGGPPAAAFTQVYKDVPTRKMRFMHGKMREKRDAEDGPERFETSLVRIILRYIFVC